ncbi:imidazoleglycerol-phosphate dehydratase [Marispirochaeta aestuarii]|uniref:Imidazoleglycerol-phosphate dehydratase n=1 Tax=Marispirochaeta aestuarii TaxID=1963862 RepID=A0A1Y1S444_9SPIO|nr:imidazoleglycerol-phosphate dehydratase HisB [Marispirochaeta aestuarii]ORC38304.1 imidazoleglycerol-phosphate dehydratase [Marispirochaeta aestuarii]
METRRITQERNTKETRIRLILDLDSPKEPQIDTPVPFFNHILNSMAFHGGFFLQINASGDIDVDPHHLVEDTGLVLGDALREAVMSYGSIQRFGHSVIPMDDALSEVTVDASGRPFLVFNADFPQEYAGSFPLCLLKEFFTALSTRGGLTVHGSCRYGDNSHHMAEALFKALGKALGQAFIRKQGNPASTKGSLHE